jgi:hypothetical protein
VLISLHILTLKQLNLFEFNFLFGAYTKYYHKLNFDVECFIEEM